MTTSLKRLCIFIAFSSNVIGQDARTPEITGAELIRHIKYLASDKLEGRRSGTQGAELAARYIADEFKSYGLEPKGDSGGYFQSFDFVSGVRIGRKNAVSLFNGPERTEKSLQLDLGYRPIGFSSSGTFEGEVIFVGYGISSPEKKYDDYQGMNVRGRAVLMMRYSPDGDNPHGEMSSFSSLRMKVSRAKDMGASAVIVVTGPLESPNDELMKLEYDRTYGNAGIEVINIQRIAADNLLEPMKHSVQELQSLINSSRTPHSFETGWRVRLTVDLEEMHQVGRNVVGYVRGADERLREETIVIGAHYDHLGMGGEGSLSPDTVAVHHGADDNASGTAGLLEIAQKFASESSTLKRSVLLIAFSGEEMGLLGSAHYVKHPEVPLETTVAMLNMDEIGRLRDRKLIVFGTGTSSSFESLLQGENHDSAFVLRLNKDGYGPSDHASFYAKGIPVLHFFTDIHPDYHRPSDVAERINVPGSEQVTRYVARIAIELDNAPERPSYVKVDPPRQPGESRGFRVYVGTIPDYSEQAEGMKISGVREGSPASKGGLQPGDVIVKFGKVDVRNVYDYTFALGEYKPGDEVEVVVHRGKETKSLKLKLERRN